MDPNRLSDAKPVLTLLSPTQSTCAFDFPMDHLLYMQYNSAKYCMLLSLRFLQDVMYISAFYGALNCQ
jgi:hypothetical protein